MGKFSPKEMVMTLAEIRALFESRSGRSDLVKESGADDGADFFIQSGQRMLDRMVGMTQSFARSFKTLEIGDYYAIFKGCRAVKEVWISNSDGRTELVKVSLSNMRTVYYDDAPDEITSGDPVNYCLISLRTYPDADNVIIDYLYDHLLEDDATEDYEYNGIIISPPPDEASQLEVFGLFYSPPLSSDSDTSYWTVNHPEILLMAALYHLEVSYRNTEGANDWLGAIGIQLAEIEKDWVEGDIVGVTQIEG